MVNSEGAGGGGCLEVVYGIENYFMDGFEPSILMAAILFFGMVSTTATADTTLSYG